MWNRDGRHAALDRAQALLSAQRSDVDALVEDLRASTSLGGGGGNRFLKKAIPKATASTQSPQFSKNQAQNGPERRYVASFQQGSQSAALSRLASIEGRIRARQQAQQSMTHGHAVQGDPRHGPGISVPGISSSHGHPPPGLTVALPSSQSPSDDPGSPSRKRFLKKTSALATA
ncbi:hypothetical protein CRUP_009734, partial [Coryphaenoides rupestris]